jgi:hypothetical protein
MSDKTKNILWKLIEFILACIAGAGGGAAAGAL